MNEPVSTDGPQPTEYVVARLRPHARVLFWPSLALVGICAATGFFGGEHAYDLDAARKDQLGAAQRKRKASDVDISVDVDQLADSDKLDKDALRKEYELRQRAEAAGQWQSIDQEDLADMIAAESRKRVKRDSERGSKR